MLQVEQLHQYYGGSHILRGLSFDVKVGEVTCLLGRNGVGKTTLLKAVMGLADVKAGAVRLVGTAQAGIIEHACALLDRPDKHAAMAQAISPYGDGRAAQHICRILLERKI